MRELILKMSMSMDGFVAGPNGELDWMFPSMSEEGADWVVSALRESGVHIMGSRTYYDMAAYWPSSTEVFAEPMNTIPKIVFTHSGPLRPLDSSTAITALRDASEWRDKQRLGKAREAFMENGVWAHTTVAQGPLAEEIAQLKAQAGKPIWAHGGASFARSLVELDLIDEYRLVVHPAILGRGLPIFDAVTKTRPMKLVSSTRFETGVVANVYRRA